jgi:hypothetical protein
MDNFAIDSWITHAVASMRVVILDPQVFDFMDPRLPHQEC